MSSMKGGFTTLNRWLGRKKDKSGVGSANGKLSKSTTQLHHMSTDQGMHINEASQLDYNRITPMPAATSNAPFEQTFRITVLLPKDQLYVARLGARVPLSKLLSLVCDNKQLDADKYEFRNPVDASQVYSCELSIGAVGLSEIRLCHKSESYDSFNADSMLKFQRTGGTRDSLSSSSEFSSSRHSHSKLTAKTPSPYSSSNSLNSMDSTGMNYTRTPVVPPKALAPPPRKKRLAPRPPSQLVIPEQSVAQFNETPRKPATPTEPAYAVIVKRPQLCMSTPNLASTPELETEPPLELDCNGNSAKVLDASDASGIYATLERKPNGPSLPEPTPRKRLMQLKKKTAPAPPPETVGAVAGAAAAAAAAGAGAGSAPAADTISLASTTASISEMVPTTPQPAPRITTPLPLAATATPSPTTTPVALQLQMEPTPTPTPPALPTSAAPQLPSNGSQNVSKVLLNRTPTPEPRSLGSATEEEDNNDAASKQADSGIGEPLPSPLPSSSPSPEPEADVQSKSHIESSSDDDEAIKVYNFKTSSKSCMKVKAGQEPQLPSTLAELSFLTAQQQETEDEQSSNGQPSPRTDAPLTTPNSASELTSLSSWNYAGPISPPPDFSDGLQLSRPKSTPSSPLDEIVDELSTIIQNQKLDTLIRQAPEQQHIEAAKPSRLANFSIASISNGNGSGAGHVRSSSSSRNGSNSSSPTITRADSFQAATQSPRHSHNGSALGLRLRSSSQLSLNRMELNGNGSLQQQQRRSSSELSIGESPSLQSLELIKTILSNSRKNSLEQSPDAVDSTAVKPQFQPQESPKPKSPTEAPAALPAPVTPETVTSTAAVTKLSTQEATTKTTYEYTKVSTTVSKEVLTVAPASPVASTSTTTIESATKAVPAPASAPVTVASSNVHMATSEPTVTVTVPVAEPMQTEIVPAAVPKPKPKPNPNPKPSSPTEFSVMVEGVVTNGNHASPEPESELETEMESQSAPEPVAKPLPSTYRYSGPPSINFATWSERPKSQVAIKNEGDYIYGGAQAATATSPKPAKLTIEVASPILRMGIPRKEYHVPITVKPLRDASQERDMRPVREREPERENQPDKQPEKESQREESKPQPEPEQTLIREQVKPSTLPRPAKSNRFTLPASVHMQNINSTSSSSSSSSTTNSLPRPVSTMEKAPAAAAEPVAAPFGQNTLRRTGFKERMLAREQQEQDKALRVRVSVNGTTAAPAAASPPTPAAKPVATSPPIPAAKPSPTLVQLRSRTEQQQEKEAPFSPAAKPTATLSPTPAAKATVTSVQWRSSKAELHKEKDVSQPAAPLLQVKLRPTSLMQATPAAKSTATPSPPPPPAPPMLTKAKTTRSVQAATPTSPDPRSQLLEAIRNFKREELNRA